MKFLGFNKVLCLSPHPDDVEYSLAGTIMKFKDTQFDILCLTQGTSTDISSSEGRLSEVKSFWKYLKLPNVTLRFSGIKTFEEMFSAQWITWIENNTQFANSYEAILGTSNLDSHYEHILVNTFMQALCRSRCISILEYKSPSTLHTWIPNFSVEIKKEFSLKRDALRKAFISQLDAPYFTEACIEVFHHDYLNFKKGNFLTESFRIVNLHN
jgi:LmbE family N-acetylglucosaminyl deacetylase